MVHIKGRAVCPVNGWRGAAASYRDRLEHRVPVRAAPTGAGMTPTLPTSCEVGPPQGWSHD